MRKIKRLNAKNMHSNVDFRYVEKNCLQFQMKMTYKDVFYAS